MDGLINRIIREVSELPDRTSPADQPQMLLVTEEELRGILHANIGNVTLQGRVCVEMRDIANAEIEQRLRALVRERPLRIPVRSGEDTIAVLERHIRKAMREPDPEQKP